MKTYWNVFLAIETISEANCAQHWSVKRKRHQSQKKAIWAQFMHDRPKIDLPCKIKLTRQSILKLDSGDNLPMSMKYCRDAIADLLIPGLRPGFADSDERLIWEYDQRKGRPKGIEISISALD